MADIVTTKKLLSTISVAIDERFPDIPVTAEQIDEGIDDNYFFIRLLETSHTRELYNRFKKSYPIVVHYFDEARSNINMYDVADALTESLARPKMDDRELLGYDMRYQINDDVLFFYVTYDLLVFEELNPEEKIESTELEVKVRYE